MKHPNDWHLLERDDVLHSLAVDMYKGLSEKDVRQRRRSAGANTIWHVPGTSAWEVALAAIFDLASLLLIISAAAAAFFDKSTEAGALVLILLIGGALRAVTYIRASRILEDCAREKIPTTSVIREGRIHLIPATDIVPGDIVVLEQGDTVPADGRVIAGEDSIVSERGITENKTPVHKFDTVIETEIGSGEVPCEFRSNMLFAGSLMLSGSVRMAVTASGEAALISRKQGGIALDAADRLPMIEKLRTRSKTTSLVMLACVMLLTALSLFLGESTSLPDVFLGTMSMAVAAMSEFLTIIGTIMIAVAVRDAAEISAHAKTSSRAVIRQPEKLESIRDIRRIVFCGSLFFKSGRSELYAYRAKGSYSLFGKSKTGASPHEMLALALAASAENTAGLSAGNVFGHGISDTDAVIQRAVDSYVKKSGEPLDSSYALYDHTTSDNPQAMGMEISLIARNDDIWAVSVGSLDNVLRCCTTAETSDGTEPLSDELKRKIYTECAKLEFSGASVVAVALRKSPYMQLNRLSVLTQYMTFVGFFAVAEEPEKNALQNISALKSADVVPILFTQKPDADLYYCHRIGLFNKNTVRVRAADLTEEIVDALGKDGMIVSFADISRAHIASANARTMKCIMHNRVSDTDRILQEDDEAAPVTAAVGRETWDSGVLAAADVGIAAARSNMRTVPETLSRNASVLVHKDSRHSADAGFGGLDGVMRAIRASSRIHSNIASAKSYLTASQTARLVVLLGAVLFDIPLLPAVFILIWGLLFDFAAVLMMAFEAPAKTEEDNKVSVTERKREAGVSVLSGIFWGAILAGWIPFVRLIAAWSRFRMTTQEELAILAAAVILSGAVCAFAGIRISRGGGKQRTGMAGGLFTLASVILVLLLTLTEYTVIGGSFCGWKAVLAAGPAILAAGGAKIFEILSGKRAEKRKKASDEDEESSENSSDQPENE